MKRAAATFLLALALAPSAAAMRGVPPEEAVTSDGAELVVASVVAPSRALTGRRFSVAVEIAERTGRSPGVATVILSDGTNIVGTASDVIVPAGGVTRVPFVVSFAAPGPSALTASVSLATQTQPVDVRTHTLTVTDFAVNASRVLVSSFGGFGGQMNQHAYAQISRDAGMPDDASAFETPFVALQPQLVRVFFNSTEFTQPDRMDSFVRTMQLAQRSGAVVNVTWQGGSFTEETAAKFTAVLDDLITSRGVTNIRWVTLQNEVNATNVSGEQYEAMYRTLDKALVAAGLRGRIHFMGGDLVQTNQQAWFQYMAVHMSDLLDAYSIHVFWDYWDTLKLQRRLADVRAIVDTLPADARKPLYVMEYGVRGLKSFDGAEIPQPGVFSDGTPMRKTKVNAFQHVWFDVLAMRLGFVGTVKWDSYWGKYDNGSQAFYMINGPTDGWSLNPVYWSTRLLTLTTRRGARAVGVDGTSGTKVLTAFVESSGATTVLGLDAAGATLNAPSATQSSYTIGNLPQSAPFRLLVWNREGGGTIDYGGVIATDASGVATLTVPVHAVFALTSLAV